MRYDKAKTDRIRESVRIAVAQALNGTAQALAAASKAAAATASQLRPPEAAEARPPTRFGGSPARTAASSSPSAPASPPPAPRATASAPSSEPRSAPAAVPPDRTTAGTDGGKASQRDLNALANGNAKDVIAEIPDLGAGDLRRLRSVEAEGKARKTVLAAIERALES